jgi:thiosulfate/3-mercaptopyruvate sulfurtransferase
MPDRLWETWHHEHGKEIPMSLVTTDWLAKHLTDPDVRVCDVRWYLPISGRSGGRVYAAGHLPGAVFLDLDHELASPDDGSAGRHPLPAKETFVAAMRRAGVGPSTHVVAYDDAGGSVAARLWWLLRAHGHARVSLLDGGIGKWKAETRTLTTEVPVVPPGMFESCWDPASVRALDQVRAGLRHGATVLDARARERYRGDTEPVDPRPGHIPGATSAPFAESLDQGAFRDPAEVRARFASLLGDKGEVIASCGSGVTACHTLFVLDWTGVRPFPSAKLYVGSYSEWSRHRDLPVAVGDAPGQPA